MGSFRPPLSNEFELTLFGNGYGECVLLHMGDNKWIIVDSCINPWTQQVAPLEYLEAINVDISKSVEMLVVSHWHDDHIKGVGQICKSCENARFALSNAMHQRDFFRFVNVVNERPVYSYAGKSADEIMHILNAMVKRKEKSGEHPHIWASIDKVLYADRISDNGSDAKVTALSPSDHAVTTALIEIAKLIPRANTAIKVESTINPNLFAIALWVSIGNIRILLGSDLEEAAHPLGAWSVIANSGNKPAGKADAFKVSHHGSKNAHCDHVYDKMLTERHISVLTPFTHGKVVLPNDSDIRRLKKQKCSALYMACKSSSRTVKHDPAVEKILKESTKSRKTLSSFGRITLRKRVSSDDDDWQIFTEGHAYEL